MSTEGEILMEGAALRRAEKAEAERNPPAFPCPDTGCNHFQPGMELRDHFAGLAMQGQITWEGMEGCDPEHIAGMSYQLADAMLAERAKKKGEVQK